MTTRRHFLAMITRPDERDARNPEEADVIAHYFGCKVIRAEDRKYGLWIVEVGRRAERQLASHRAWFGLDPEVGSILVEPLDGKATAWSDDELRAELADEFGMGNYLVTPEALAAVALRVIRPVIAENEQLQRRFEVEERIRLAKCVEVERLRKALGFYADHSMWVETVPGLDEVRQNTYAEFDHGERARRALADESEGASS